MGTRSVKQQSTALMWGGKTVVDAVCCLFKTGMPFQMWNWRYWWSQESILKLTLFMLERVNYLSKPGLHRWQCFAFQDVKQKTLFSSLDYQGVKISPLLSCVFLWKHLKWCCKLISQKAPTCSTGIGCPEMCGCPILGGFRGWVG